MVPNRDYTVITLDQFIEWLEKTEFKRKITWVAWHHTASPTSKDVAKKGFAYYVKAVQRVHMGRGWVDSAQHIAINNNDGTIILCRDFELNGGGITSDPVGDITVEVFANFDAEQMTAACRKTILGVMWTLHRRFGINLDEYGISYHHWWNLIAPFNRLKDGEQGTRKTCPGKNFFGGYKIADFKANFLPALEKYGKEYEAQREIDRIIELLVKKKYVNAPLYWRDVLEKKVAVQHTWLRQLLFNISKETSVDGVCKWMMDRKIITSSNYWYNVLAGIQVANIDWLIILLGRLVNI